MGLPWRVLKPQCGIDDHRESSKAPEPRICGRSSVVNFVKKPSPVLVLQLQQ